MSKIQCNCGQIIPDQSDFIKHKAHFVADQDYFDLLDEIENREWNDLATRASKYFSEIFQCNSCNSLIVFKDKKRFDFAPLDKDKSSGILTSYLGQKWLGTLSANFRNGQGDIFWSTNLESGFRQNLALEELRQLYHQKYKELTDLNILRHSFLNINGIIEHVFKHQP
ncbi:hypothetical protein EG359_02325 [Chryseobacterium joostei]|uniref:Uncharacterized protein n=1 Tax=Chryseobacterium joostei TaxID=112234 RepID=A0A1N7IM11_9FLAO|nr:hypothetical protein [Chryseobacterium joostei]AZA98511.1 hypothetical protein EG359_02325 [Chryseobacterium joostei]SIS38110.1 hypothetical protein SAMN05421768_10661 [Chryseobacterium joostei]